MERMFVVLLFSLFTPYFTGLLTDASMSATGLVSFDKAAKFILVYLLLITAFVKGRKINFQTRPGGYFWLAGLYLLILVVHYLFSADADTTNALRAQKEVVRLVTFTLLMLICATISLRKSDLILLIVLLGAFGIPLGLLSIEQSMTGSSSISWKHVGNYLRAGTDIVDANALGAVLNLTAFSALASFMIARKWWHKAVFLSSIIISQIARFSTFSSGSLISLCISVATVLVLLRKFNRKAFGSVLKALVAGIAAIVVILIVTGAYQWVFYRISLSDEHVVKASVTSRLRQYEGFWELLRNEPLRIFYGTGTAYGPDMLGAGADLHNSYLRPLLVAGILGFASFIYLWYRSLRIFYSAAASSIVDKDITVIRVLIFSAFIGWSFQAATIPVDTTAIMWFFFILAFAFTGMRDETAASGA